jgi:hypothetical protein
LLFEGCDERRVSHKVSKPKLTWNRFCFWLSKTIFKILFSYFVRNTDFLLQRKRFYEKVYFNFDCRNIFSTLHAQSPWTKKRKAYVARNFSTLLQQSTNRWNPKTLAADNTDIATQIYTGYGLTNNLEA